MNALRQAAQAVVDRFDGPDDADLPGIATFVRRLRTALAAPEQEPVAYFNMAINETVGCIAYEYGKHGLKSGAPLYAAPVDIEALTKERDEWVARHEDCCRLMGECMQDRADMETERDEYQQAADTQAAAHKVELDELMLAAKLALKTLEKGGMLHRVQAITALKKAGV